MFNPEYENLPNFKAFVARQPAEQRYPYSNSADCACARWLRSEDRFDDQWLNDSKLTGMNELARGPIDNAKLMSDQWTFGQLLDRINAKEKELA